MALDNDELKKRRAYRAQLRRQRRAARRRVLLGVLAGLVLLCIGIAAILLLRNRGETQPEPSASTAAVLTDTVIHIVAGGDLNVTDAVVESGRDGLDFDFTKTFLDVAPVLAAADVTVLNLEGNLAGEPYGSQTTSAPQELAQALARAGVDYLQLANSCTINNGLLGLRGTLDGVRAAGLAPLGAYATAQEAEAQKGYTICNVQGVRVAFLAFTKGVGSLGLPQGSEKCVNLLYSDYSSTYQKVDTQRIREVLNAVAAESPDVTIALLHWGSEYNDTISKTQKTILKLMQDGGVDAVIGTHAHRVQQLEYDAEKGTVVAYCLGDFYGDATRGGTDYSVLLDLEITRDAQSGETKITDCTYTPIYTVRDDEGKPQKVMRIREAMLGYEANHIDRISASDYAGMKAALERIENRLYPPE